MEVTLTTEHEHGPGCDEECCEDWQEEPDCADGQEHVWSSEDMGGCTENPGVWSLGGTTLLFKAQCEHCGIVRTEKLLGSQRNEFDCDTRTFEHDR